MLLSATYAWSQGAISGHINDKQSGDAIAYASITLHHVKDSTMVARVGAVSDEEGNFTVDGVPYGTYLLRISFMGYQTYWHPTTITLSATNRTVRIGTITIRPASTTLRTAEVTAERSMMEYQLDRRVINVDKNLVAGGGTANDLLETVPSVSLDSDGNVTLRGSTNVKVLIDGRPSELLSSDLSVLLDQIPASSIENIEVITNPSAKYDPEGMSGIINIKLKDRTSNALGLNGTASLNAGTPLFFAIPDGLPAVIPSANGSINLNYSTEKYTITISADANRRSRSRTSDSYIDRFDLDGTRYSSDSLYQLSLDPSLMGSAKLGFEYFINDHNSLMLSYQLRGGNHGRQKRIHDVDLLHDALGNYLQTDTSNSRSLNHSVNLNYTHRFDQKDQLFTLDATFSTRRGWGDGQQQQLYDNPTVNYANYYLRESASNSRDYNGNIQINYVQPLGGDYKLETGYEGRFTNSDQNNEYHLNTYDTAWSLQRYFDDLSSTHYTYSQNIHALYLTLGGTLWQSLSAQAGLRGEYSSIDGHDELHPATQSVHKTYWQLYPTLHVSYLISKQQSVQFSYSRRVRRPRMWDLNPYLNVREGEQLSFGNPSLDPEFTNAFELSYNLSFAKTNIYTSLYYRNTNNQLTWFGFVWNEASVAHYAPWMTYNAEYDNYWASTAQNLGSSTNAGVELILDQQITSWWRINVSGNFYQAEITGSALLGDTTRTAFRASGKLSSYMNLSNDWTIQLSAQYNAPFFDLQTDMFASYWADLAIKKDLWNHRGTLTLRISDLFATAGWGNITENEQMYRWSNSKRVSPEITLGFSYKINQGLKTQSKPETYDDDESSLSY